MFVQQKLIPADPGKVQTIWFVLNIFEDYSPVCSTTDAHLYFCMFLNQNFIPVNSACIFIADVLDSIKNL